MKLRSHFTRAAAAIRALTMPMRRRRSRRSRHGAMAVSPNIVKRFRKAMGVHGRKDAKRLRQWLRRTDHGRDIGAQLAAIIVAQAKG